jgi:hypothetical protein
MKICSVQRTGAKRLIDKKALREDIKKKKEEESYG